MSLALVVSRKSNIYWAKAFALHMFFQFYREFTPDLLNEFFANEKIYSPVFPKQNNKIKVEEGNSR